MEFASIVGNHHAVLGQRVSRNHQIHVANGLALPFQGISDRGVVVRGGYCPGLYLESSQPGFDGVLELATAEFLGTKP